MAEQRPQDSLTLVLLPSGQHGQDCLTVARSWAGEGLLRRALWIPSENVQPSQFGGAEATGILLWEPGDHERLRAATDWAIQHSVARTRSEHEDITQRMMSMNTMSAVILEPDHLFMEVDTPQDYEVLVTEMFPRIVARIDRWP